MSVSSVSRTPKSAPGLARQPGTRAPRRAGIENRQTILRVALDVFATSGFERASTRKIAAAASIEQGHLAYYYPSKEALWRDVIEAFARECQTPLDDIAPRLGRDPPEAIARDVLPPFVESFAANGRLTRLMLQEFSVSSPRHDWLVENFGLPVWLLMKPLMEALAREGLISGAAPSVVYFNLLGGALLVFGSPAEIRSIAGAELSNETLRKQHVELLLRPIFERAASTKEEQA